MKQKYFYSILLLFLGLLGFSQTLDQQNAPVSTGGGSFTVSPSQDVGQSFTAGMTGDLSQINIRVGNWGSIFVAGDFQLRIIDGNGYGGTVLNTTTFSIPSAPATSNYDELAIILSATVPITSGNMYTIDLKGITGTVSTHGANPNYANGGLYFASGNNALYDSFDLWFKTFVNVPTPATHLNFDGINDHVNLGTSLATALNGTTALTLEAWINPSVLNGWNNIITDYNGSYHKLLLRVRNNNNIQFWLNGTVLNSSFTVPLDTWTHVAAVYDGSNMYVYANGGLVASQSATVSLPTTTDQFNIGSRVGGSELFTGNIDEVRIWNTARTVEQINGSMNCELQGSESGLVAYYQFNQGVDQADNTSITTLTDATSNGNDGTLTNFTLTGTTSNWLAGSPVETGSVVPTTPIVTTPVTYNQNDTASALTATTGGSGLLWYTAATGGTGSTSAPTPDTSTAGSTSYWVSSTNANGCESERIEVVVNVNAEATHLNFDGASDRITGTNPNLPQGNSPRTIEAWVRNSTGNDMTIFNYGNINVATNQIYTLHLYNGVYIIGYFNDINTGYNINDGNWHHVAVSHDGTNSRIYVDGVLINTTSITYNTNGYDFQIGASNRNGSYLYNLSGSLDEIRVWNVALTEADILATMNCEAQSQPELVAYYKFNQGFDAADNSSITTLTDSSGNGIDGTLTNFALTGTTSNWQSGSAVTTGDTCATLSNSSFEAISTLKVYPNPSTGIFTIASEEELTITVYDIVGKVIKTQTISNDNNILDISNYNAGVYFLNTVNTQGETKTFKLIKN